MISSDGFINQEGINERDTNLYVLWCLLLGAKFLAALIP